jgi:hypothetical protein
VYGFGRHAGCLDLKAIGGMEVEVRPPRYARANQTLGIEAARPHHRQRDVRTDFVAARADRRTESGHDPLGLHAEPGQSLDRGGGDASHRPAPAGVNRGERPTLAVGEEDRHAIGGTHADHEAREIVATTRGGIRLDRTGRIGDGHIPTVNLFQRVKGLVVEIRDGEQASEAGCVRPPSIVDGADVEITTVPAPSGERVADPGNRFQPLARRPAEIAVAMEPP